MTQDPHGIAAYLHQRSHLRTVTRDREHERIPPRPRPVGCEGREQRSLARLEPADEQAEHRVGPDPELAPDGGPLRGVDRYWEIDAVVNHAELVVVAVA